jgi:hypothetical protein
MKLRILTTVAVTAAMLAAPIAASAAPVTTDDTASSECRFGEHLLHAWLALPADLRDDLKALKDLEPGERGDAARDIRDGAQSGEYGPGVQVRAERLRERRIAVIATMPDELKSDLIELREADPAERRDLASQIAETALDGGYGEKAQEVAERIQESDAWQNCT